MTNQTTTQDLLERLQAVVAELKDIKVAARTGYPGLAGNADMALSFLNGSVTHLANQVKRGSR